MSTIYLVFEDQLAPDPPMLRAADRFDDLIIVIDAASATDPSPRRRAFRTAALDHYRDALALEGWRVASSAMDRSEGSGALGRSIKRIVGNHAPRRIVVTEPGDGDMKKKVERLAERFWVPVDILRDRRFICARSDFLEMTGGRGEIGEADFYEEIRRRATLLLVGGRLAGGRLRHGEALQAYVSALSDPAPVDETEDHDFTISASQFEAQRALDRFIEFSLPALGEAAPDAERLRQSCATLALYLEAGQLSPLRVCNAVEAEWRAGNVDLPVAEAVVYNIAGLREYRRCLARAAEAG